MSRKVIRSISALCFLLIFACLESAFAIDVCNCKGYSGVGGPCYSGPGGPARSLGTLLLTLQNIYSIQERVPIN
jgi:hypothetical protein